MPRRNQHTAGNTCVNIESPAENQNYLRVTPSCTSFCDPNKKSSPLLVSGPEARRLLDIGKTKYFALLKSKVLETVLVGRRRHVIYVSLQRLVDGGTD